MAATQTEIWDVLDRMKAEAHSPRLEHRPSPPKFGGKSYDPKLDERRLNRCSQRIFDLMKDGVWRTQSEIRTALKLGPDVAITSRLRDYRKEEFGSHTLNLRRAGDPTAGRYEYQLQVNLFTANVETNK